MRKIIHIFLSLVIVYASITNSYAASAWSVTSAVSAGARTVVTATKSGYKSAVNVAPTAGRLALKLGKGANMLALGYAVAQIIGDGVDHVLEPENNRVKYVDPVGSQYTTYKSTKYYSAASACSALAAVLGYSLVSSVKGNYWECHKASGTIAASFNVYTEKLDKYIPLSQIASKVISNANSGHAPSQAATRETATEMVIGGQFDADLLSGAVPTNDTTPLVPSVPISGNGNQSYGGVSDAGDGGYSGATPGEQADASRDAAEAAKKAAQAAADAAKAAQDAAQTAADNAADLVNSGADEAAIAAAEQAAADAKQAAADAKAVSDAAVAAANERAAAAERAAEAATQAAQAAATKAASDLAAAKAAGDAAAIAAAEAAKAAADAAVAAAKEKQAAAERAAEKAKAEAAKPFELPPFCTWAKPVCTFIDFAKAEWLEFIFAFVALKDWFFEEAPDTDSDNTVQDSSIPFTPSQVAINFVGSCPAPLTFEYKIYNQTFKVGVPFDPMCKVAILINPVIKICATIAAIYIVAGLRQGSS